ncbi:MAG: 3-methyl-2-oxobutanoate hydroxymethyltransferase [Candidatus Eisenbacteria bacterium]
MMRSKRLTVPEIKAWKRQGRKIAVLTCYDFSMARILDRCGIPILLVGDSLGQVMLGHDLTLRVTLADMIHHTRAVTRAQPRGLVVADMPFLSFQLSPEGALEAAGSLVREGGADAVKLEGGARSLSAVRKLVEAGIPVMGHLGLTPQSILVLGGYGVRGRRPAERDEIRADASALEAAGCFSLVLESIPAALAGEITAALSIPTIGIGAGPACDGQVLVLHDMLGLYDEFRPRFVRRFFEGRREIERAIRGYMEAVALGEFPGPEHSFGPDGRPLAEAAGAPGEGGPGDDAGESGRGADWVDGNDSPARERGLGGDG